MTEIMLPECASDHPELTEFFDCRIFGGLSVWIDGGKVDLGGPKQQLVLAVLLCLANSTVSVDKLVETLWSDEPPVTARKNVQVYISKLRKIFGKRLTHSLRGYRLRLGPAEFDLLRFEQSVQAGRDEMRAGNRETCIGLLAGSLEMWDDGPLPEFIGEPFVSGLVELLTARFLAVLEDWAELELDRGGYLQVLVELDKFARDQPLRERCAAIWIRALADAGRVSEALAHYDFVRRALSHELGIEPSRRLADYQQRLLRGERLGIAVPPAAGRPVNGMDKVNQLPRDLPDFVGKVVEVDAVVAELASDQGCGVVVLSGPVGTGKTALAVHAAHLLDASFPDGRVLLELSTLQGRPKSLDTVLDELMGIIGLGRQPVHSTAHALARWRSWVLDRRLLLVLDAADREDVVKALLPGSRRSRVVVTSRRRLSGLESVMRVEPAPFGSDESAELLGRIIGADRLHTDSSAARLIVDHCAGLPLAVRITGTRLSVLRHVRLGDYLDQLVNTESILGEMAAGDLDIRSRYERFYLDLPQPQRAAFRILVARLTPPFDHAAVMGALAAITRSPGTMLESLLECCLLSVPNDALDDRSTRYHMPDFAYLYGRELNSAPGEA
ncbi:MAG: hypothetical protein JWQ81_5181 [Amycolatopsis sp.]|uniref:AfsR/SARP family transcriptional regulator n=1 Tax=Amycolatopsis sp. TaxID=37632 RepID=UPI00261B8B77|nr:BTAD domain-containing putative transcriptional regulator [Amycolatopsis sp.]MCU1684442.1 hypothetical protein [Amycolatopsis sp.]